MTCTYGTSDSNWRGTARSFISHWLDQVRLYEKAVDVKAHFDESQKLVLLQKAVKSVPSLEQVAITNNQLKASGLGNADFDSYLRLLYSAADTYDKKMEHKSGGRGAARKRSIYRQEQSDPYELFDIDTPIGDLMNDPYGQDDNNSDERAVYQGAQTHKPRQHDRQGSGKLSFVLPTETYGKLTPTARSFWRKIPRDMQELIVQAAKGPVQDQRPRAAHRLEQLLQAYQSQHEPGQDPPPLSTPFVSLSALESPAGTTAGASGASPVRSALVFAASWGIAATSPFTAVRQERAMYPTVAVRAPSANNPSTGTVVKSMGTSERSVYNPR